MTIHFDKLKNFVEIHFSNKKIVESNIKDIHELFTQDYVEDLIDEILNTPELLNKISKRSYRHALGFDKIVLLDYKKDINPLGPKVHVRLHLWEPQNTGVELKESLHEHSFDFVSHILTGEITNESYSKRKTSEMESEINNLFIHKINKLDTHQLSKIEDILEDIFAKKEVTQEKLNELNLLNLNFTKEQYLDLSFTQGFFKSNRISGERDNYKHVLDSYIKLKHERTEKLKAGDTYFHDYIYPHRLTYDPKEFNSTVLITTHVPENPEGGSFQRASFKNKNEKSYEKIKFDDETLRDSLENYQLILKNQRN